MPNNLAFPPGAPTLSGDALTISRFLTSPTLVQRELRAITNQRFIGDVLLTGRVRPNAGAVIYEQDESIFADRNVESIEPGDEYPLTTTGFGPALVAAVKKWGVDSEVTLEAVMREGSNPVNRALRKMGNTLVKQVDTVCLAAITAASLQTLAAGATWGASTSVLNDLLTAKAMITSLEQGYMPDTVVVDDFAYVKLMANATVQAALQRETPENPIYTGQMGRLAGLDIMVSSHVPVTQNAIVLDRSVLGSIADEVPFTSGTRYDEDTEVWRLRVKRVTVPFVQEPSSAVKITGVQA